MKILSIVLSVSFVLLSLGACLAVVFVGYHGFTLAYEASPALGIGTLFVSPLAEYIGWVDLIGHENVAIKIAKALGI